MLKGNVKAFKSLLCPPISAADQLTSLCLGYLRNLSQEMEQFCNSRNVDHVDVAGIIMQFSGINIGAHFCGDSDGLTLKKISSRRNRDLDHPYNILILKNYNKLLNQKNQSKLTVMTVQRSKSSLINHCKQDNYRLNGFALQCGVIGIHKSIDKLFNKLFDHHLSDVYYCNLFNIMDKHPKFKFEQNEIDNNKDNINNIIDDIQYKIHTYYVYFWKYNIGKGNNNAYAYYENKTKFNQWCSFGINSKWDNKVFVSTEQVHGDVHRLNIMDNEIHINDRVTFRSHKSGVVKFIGKLNVTHWDGSMHEVEMVGIITDEKLWPPKDGTFSGIKYFDCQKGYGYWGAKDNIASINYTSEYSLDNKNDCISVCVDRKKEQLYFVKNSKFVNEKKYFGGVKQSLDFQNYKYYFAVSSPCCSCQTNSYNNDNGFEFDIHTCV